ncbi:MAG: formylmethanofuran dehydrogenase [Methanotrichaceae archaeon]|nr:formylmethanofuran dehydrogenase [Methanotrichaceae archaeon]
MFTEIKIITFEDIFQREAMKKGIFTDDYQKLSAQIIMDKQDMEKIGVKDGQNAKIENDVGSIVATVKLSDDEPHPGIAFMATSPWINQLVKEDVCQTSRPDHITAKIFSSDEETTKLSVLLERIKA